MRFFISGEASRFQSYCASDLRGRLTSGHAEAIRREKLDAFGHLVAVAHLAVGAEEILLGRQALGSPVKRRKIIRTAREKKERECEEGKRERSEGFHNNGPECVSSLALPAQIGPNQRCCTANSRNAYAVRTRDATGNAMVVTEHND